MKLTPVGWVRSPIKEPTYEDWQSVTSRIEVEPELEEALDQLEAFSHIVVVWWAHLTSPEQRARLKAHPMHDPSLPLVGVFATRSPKRPNPIGVTVARLVKRDGSVLIVKGLDAIDGTPVLDIKPYLRDQLSGKVSAPQWFTEAQKKKRLEVHRRKP